MTMLCSIRFEREKIAFVGNLGLVTNIKPIFEKDVFNLLQQRWLNLCNSWGEVFVQSCHALGVIGELVQRGANNEYHWIRCVALKTERHRPKTNGVAIYASLY